jgi:hypothetical protein
MYAMSKNTDQLKGIKNYKIFKDMLANDCRKAVSALNLEDSQIKMALEVTMDQLENIVGEVEH